MPEKKMIAPPKKSGPWLMAWERAWLCFIIILLLFAH